MRPKEVKNDMYMWLDDNGVPYSQIMGHTPDPQGRIQHLYTDQNGISRIITVDVGRQYWTEELPQKGKKKIGDIKAGGVLQMEINANVPSVPLAIPTKPSVQGIVVRTEIKSVDISDMSRKQISAFKDEKILGTIDYVDSGLYLQLLMAKSRIQNEGAYSSNFSRLLDESAIIGKPIDMGLIQHAAIYKDLLNRLKRGEIDIVKPHLSENYLVAKSGTKTASELSKIIDESKDKRLKWDDVRRITAEDIQSKIGGEYPKVKQQPMVKPPKNVIGVNPSLKQEVEVIAESYGMPKVWARKMIPLLESGEFQGISYPKSILPSHIAIDKVAQGSERAKLILHELVHQSGVVPYNKYIGPTKFRNILSNELTKNGLNELTIKDVDRFNKEVRGLEPLDREIYEILTDAYTRKLLGESVGDIFNWNVPDKVSMEQFYSYKPIRYKLARLYGEKVAKSFDNALKEYVESLPYDSKMPNINAISEKLYGKGETAIEMISKEKTVEELFDERYGRYREGRLPVSLKKEITLVRAKPEERIAQERVVGERIVGERSVGERGIGERGIGERPIAEQGVGERGEGERGVGERPIGERGVGERGVGERGVGERGETRRADRGEQRRDIPYGNIDRVPPTRLPPRILPRIIPPKPPITRFEEAKKKLGDNIGIIAWKQGFIYKLLYKPYSQEDILNTRKPIEGVEYHEGIRSAYDSIIRRGGYVPPIIRRNMGIYDVEISTMKDQRKPELRFRRDIKYTYKGKKRVAKMPRIRIVRF
jgi:hypothetical protein